MKNLKKPSKIVLMSFAAGEAADENAASFVKYIGVTPVNVVALNPTKDELEKMLGRELTKDIEYFNKDINGKPQIRLDFWVQADPNWGRQLEVPLQKVSFFVSESVRVNKDSTKVQVIDKYGNTGWVNREEFKTQTIPSNLARLTTPYRECYSGEDKLINFIKCWLNIPENALYKNGVWEFLKDMSKCEAEFKNIKGLIKGDIKDLQGLVKKYAAYKVKVCFGIKTTDENKKYQTIYTGLFLKHSSGNYDRFETAIKKEKDNGALANVEYSSEQLKVYEIEPSKFDNVPSTSMPTPKLPDITSFATESLPETTELELPSDDLPF